MGMGREIRLKDGRLVWARRIEASDTDLLIRFFDGRTERYMVVAAREQD